MNTLQLLVLFVFFQGYGAFGSHKLAMYWGQSAAGPVHGNQEWDMDKLCMYGKMDIILVGFVTKFWDQRDKDKLPYINLSHHCYYSIDPNHPYLWGCRHLGWNADTCQKLGKKVLISLGGDTVSENLGSANKARELARTIWELFLGGKKYAIDTKPFGRTILDGVDLDIEKGSPNYYSDFIKELRMLMDADTSKTYLITGAPQCPYPDFWLGPEDAGKALTEAGHLVDYLFIQFYNNYCYPGSGYFDSILDKWLAFARGPGKGRPQILVGLPAEYRASGKAYYYKTPAEVAAIYKKIKDKPNFGGFMLWDSSWDQNNVINNKRYSSYIYDMMAGSVVTTPAPTIVLPPTNPPTFLPTDISPTTTSSPPPTQPPITNSPGGTTDCSVLGDGYYKNPKDCAAFIQCSGGEAYNKNCPSGLLWNDTAKLCDWPGNVLC